MRVLIDGDIVVYRAAASAEKDDQWIALTRADKMIQEILEDTGATSYNVYLTGDNNFRREIAPSYKANRPDTRPQHWAAVREFLVTQHKARICHGYEADDQMGIEQDKVGGTTVIASIDKDMMQVPGKHWNFVRKEAHLVSLWDGIRALYTQALVGDRSDNIIGVVGIGPKKAEGHLEGLIGEDEYYEKVRELYNDDERLHLNMKLLYIWRKPNDMWEPPTSLGS